MIRREQTEGGLAVSLAAVAASVPRGMREFLGLGTVAVAAMVLDLAAVASVAGVVAVLLPLYVLTRRFFDDGSAVTPVIAAFTLFWFGMLAAIEILSALSLLGSRPAWTLLTVGCAAGLQFAASRRSAALAPARPASLGLLPLRHALHEPWTIVVGPVALVLGILFAQSVYLNLFTGINHTDAQQFYMARSVRYLQDGTLSAYSTINDFLPHFHQTISAYVLLFFQSESAILLLSSLFGGMTALVLFDLSRLIRPPVSLSVLVGVSPMAVTIFNLHLGTSNFDIHTGVFLLTVIYFLLLLLRTGRLPYLILAAGAVALALATKLTFWFAAPPLLILWIAALVVVLRRRGLRTAATWAALAALIVALGGVHYARNAWTQGFLITPNLPEYGQSSPTTPRDRFDVTAFHFLASSTAILTPSILVDDYGRVALVEAFKSSLESIGIRLPNPTIFTYPERSWNDVFDHLRTPFHNDKAGFGAIVPLVVAPAALFVVVEGLRRRTFLTLPHYVVLFAALYLLTLSYALKYAADHVRYQIEMVAPLLILVPVVIARLPVAAGLLYLAIVGGFMVTDAYQAHTRNAVRPPDEVMAVPRDLQYATFVAPQRMGYYTGARVLNLKYPVEHWPEVFLLRQALNRGQFFEYPFLDTEGRRRLPSWATDLQQPRPAWPGPLLVTDQGLAETLQARFADQLALDRLSDLVWVALPLDRLRLLWSVMTPDGVSMPLIRVEARVSGEQYQRPEYRFTAVRSASGEHFSEFRAFSEDPTYALPRNTLSPVLDMQVEVREAGQQEAAEQARVPMASMLRR